MVFRIIIPIKWLFHWEYTLFSVKPIFVVLMDCEKPVDSVVGLKIGLEQSGITLNEKVHFTLIGTISNYLELVPNDFGGLFMNGLEAFGTVLKRSKLWLEVSVFFWSEIIAGNPVLSWHQLFVIQAGLANRQIQLPVGHWKSSTVPTRHVSLQRALSSP